MARKNKLRTTITADLLETRNLRSLVAERTVQVFLATDRPMSFREVWNQPEYSDYPFTLINLELRPDLKGKGTMILAAQITADETGRFVHVTNYGSTPVQLNELRAEVVH